MPLKLIMTPKGNKSNATSSLLQRDDVKLEMTIKYCKTKQGPYTKFPTKVMGVTITNESPTTES